MHMYVPCLASAAIESHGFGSIRIMSDHGEAGREPISGGNQTGRWVLGVGGSEEGHLLCGAVHE